MKVIRTILYVLVFLTAFFSFFILVCAFRPSVTERIQSMLYQDSDEEATADAESDDYYDVQISSISYPPQDTEEIGQDDDTESIEVQDDNPSGDSIQTDAETGVQGDSLRNDTTAEYIAPDESEIVVPGNVSGKNGYKQIEGDEEQVDDETADDLQSQLDYGYTGDGLDFNALYYPYYNMLDDKGKHVYRQVYANADAVYPTFMPVENVNASQLRNIFAAVYNDHPELFWVETAYSCKFTRSGLCIEIDLSFNSTTQELDSAKNSFDVQAAEIIAGTEGLADNYSKEKYVHDQLLEKVSYNSGAEMNQSAYSALVNGQTVCAGYSRAFQYILQQLGIPCYYCTGYAGESHAWNIVQLSDGFYNVDTTWDDAADGSYDYFNKTDNDYESSHIRQELSVYLPSCNGQMYRDLEQSDDSGDGQPVLKSLADTGVSEDRVFTDINSYYEDCYNQMMQNGIGSYTFYSVISGSALANEVMASYRSGYYRDAYMQNAVDTLGAAYCTWEVDLEPLQDDMYLFSHEIRSTE